MADLSFLGDLKHKFVKCTWPSGSTQSAFLAEKEANMGYVWEYFDAYRLTASVIDAFLASVFKYNGPFHTQVSAASKLNSV